MPTLLSDINRHMDAWGVEGTMDPFKHIFNLVFWMTVQIISCKELSNNLRMLKKMYDIYWKIEKSTTPVSLHLLRSQKGK